MTNRLYTLLQTFKIKKIMSDLKNLNITEDAKKRVEWIHKRRPLNGQQKEFIEFQIKEAVINALRLANEDIKQPEKALVINDVNSSLVIGRFKLQKATEVDGFNRKNVAWVEDLNSGEGTDLDLDNILAEI